MTLKLPQELEQRLRSVASRHGLDPFDLAVRLLESGLAANDVGTLQLLDSWDAEDAGADDQELARRSSECERLRHSMNESRRMFQGEQARKVYP